MRRYQVLDVSEDSPKLPAGYLTLAPLLFIPPLWRAVMDPVLMNYVHARRKDKQKLSGTPAKKHVLKPRHNSMGTVDSYNFFFISHCGRLSWTSLRQLIVRK